MVVVTKKGALTSPEPGGGPDYSSRDSRLIRGPGSPCCAELTVYCQISRPPPTGTEISVQSAGFK